ncbi:MAG: beta-galactosidase [Clostridia bacterium]|nr:beta-galactosidase [Clostridia bacterium]
MTSIQPIGRLKAKAASEWTESRLGIGFEKLDRGVFEPERAYDKLGKIGVKWVRLQSGWARTEKEPGKYDFKWLDDIVDNLISRGMLPWICLCYGNALYDDFAKEIFGAVGCPPIYTEEQKTAWHNYVVETARHFKGRVKHFEVWNEPDGLWCWKKGVSATDLGNFVIDTAKALKEGNEDCYVIGGSVCTFTATVDYMHEALSTGMGEYIDGITFHEYTYTEENVTQKVCSLRGLCALHGISPEIIQGESGAQSRADGHGAMWEGNWTPRIQAKQLLRHLTIDLLNDVKFTSFFTCVDMIEALNGKVGDLASYLDYGYFGVLGADFNEEGLATGNYTPKPSYYALQNLSSLLGGKLKVMDLPLIFIHEPAPHLGGIMTAKASETIYGGFRLDNGAYAVAYWKPEDLMTTEWTGAVTMKTAIPGEVHLVDPMDGTVYDVTTAETDKYGSTLLKFLPSKDYPLFLVFGQLTMENL